jgi:hypothetical protein
MSGKVANTKWVSLKALAQRIPEILSRTFRLAVSPVIMRRRRRICYSVCDGLKKSVSIFKVFVLRGNGENLRLHVSLAAVKPKQL